jgi:predicted dithiol-disulfide oxidoreductase (DUF899 family)
MAERIGKSQRGWLSRNRRQPQDASRAPYAKLAAYQKRMGWTFKWLSSSETKFNVDYFVSFTPDEVAAKSEFCNFARQDPRRSDREGVSVFHKDAVGRVVHSYSTYARGSERFVSWSEASRAMCAMGHYYCRVHVTS